MSPVHLLHHVIGDVTLKHVVRTDMQTRQHLEGNKASKKTKASKAACSKRSLNTHIAFEI